MSDQRHVLYFSSNCPHCTQFRRMLVKKPDLEAKFVKVSVDGGRKPPSHVRQVPFVEVHDERGQKRALVGAQAFAWLRQQIEKHAGEFTAYDSCVMSSQISDMFSFVDQQDRALTHNFEWLTSDGVLTGGLHTPDEETYGGGSVSQRKVVKTELDRIIEQRNRDVPLRATGTTGPGPRPPEIDFTQPAPRNTAGPHRLSPQQIAQQRRRDARIRAPTRGIDFGAPSFSPGQSAPPRRAPPNAAHQPRLGHAIGRRVQNFRRR